MGDDMEECLEEGEEEDVEDLRESEASSLDMLEVGVSRWVCLRRVFWEVKRFACCLF